MAEQLNFGGNIESAGDSSKSCAIVIVSYNCWEHLHNCIQGLAEQTFRDFQVFIIDNGEADPAQAATLARYPYVTYRKSTENLGFAGGNNAAFPDALAFHWVVLLNPDTIPESDWLEQLMKAAHESPEFAVLGSRLLKADNPELLDGDGDCYHVSGMPWRSGMGLPATHFPAKPYEIFAPCAAAAMYRSDVLAAAGGFDTDFFCYLEDVDLGFRLRLAGHSCLSVPAAKVRHVGSATTGKRSDFYIYHGQRNLIWVYFKNMPGLLFWLFLPLHAGINFLAVLRYTLTGQAGIVWKAKWHALKSLPHILRKRRAIQKSRKASQKEMLQSLDKGIFPGRRRAMSSLWK